MSSSAHEQILQWANELIDLTRRNPSLHTRTNDPSSKRRVRSSLGLVRPGLLDLLDLLGRGRLDFYLPPPPVDGEPPPEPPGDRRLLVTDRAERADVDATLRALARQAEADLLDKGLRTLYCCFGVLEWLESEDDDSPLRSPLVFVPVRLERSSVRLPYQLVRAEGDAVLNPSLRARLERDFDLVLPELDDPEAFEPSALQSALDAVRRSCDRPGWRVVEHVLLRRATFHKEAMYRDLRDNLETIAAHPLVQALADPSSGTLAVGDIDVQEQQVDDVAPPEKAHLILDADATQRRAVHAALGGKSFVMDGPPGSGKSQTIANMIAELVAAGRSVLFVSEKVPALEVVANRLRDRGLDHLLFELHSEKATRKEVAAGLGYALDNAPVARTRLGSADLEHARQLRMRLSAYADAANDVREPIGRTVHWVLGRLSQLADAPSLPPPSGIDERLDRNQLIELMEQFDELARLWDPVEDPDRFVWRDLSEAGNRPGADYELGRLLDGLVAVLRQARDHADALAYEAGLPAPDQLAEARRLMAVCAHCQGQPATEPSWWVHPELETVERRAVELAALTEARAGAAETLAGEAGPRWAELPPDAAGDLRADLRALESLRPALQIETMSRSEIDRLLALCRATGDLAEELRVEGQYLAAALGAEPRDRSVRHVARLGLVGEQAAAVVRPEPEWAATAVAAHVEQAVRVLEPLVRDYRHRRAALTEVFDDRVFELDLQGLVNRFEQVHRGLRKLSRGYRDDKRAVAAVSRIGKASAAVRARLPEALAVARLGEQIDQHEATSRELLGRFFRPRATDTDAATQALTLLRYASEQLGTDYNAAGVAAQLAGTGPRDTELASRSQRLRGRLERWRESLEGLAGEDLEELTPTQLGSWAERAIGHLAACRDVLNAVEGIEGRPVTVQRGAWLLDRRAEVHAADTKLAEGAGTDPALFGSRYRGFETPWVDLLGSIRWTQELQRRYGGPMPDGAVPRLRGQAPDPAALGELLDALTKQSRELAGWFEPARGMELLEELEGHLLDAEERVRVMVERRDQVDLWRAYTWHLAQLRQRGWSAPLDQCIADRLPAHRLPAALERALYSAWYEAVLRGDPVLGQSRPEQLDATVERFRQLDRSLVQDGAERVIDTYLRRRPTTTIGPAGIIRHQAKLKRRHMPIRILLERTAEVVTSLKPCFMMSPLTVSQFLPATFRFDVVVFDEASQITPADAVNCIYRGNQLIVAGDDRQLPPTSFFQAGAADDEGDVWEEDQLTEFESVLDLCKGTAGLPSVPLRWHYRSRHESLIAFSNYRFYDGKLITFPSAVDRREDLGVAFHLVDGRYRRGGPRDNPAEAQAVAELIRHHASRPDPPSIGVVAFSQPQAETILNAIDRMLAEHPDLEESLGGDRLRRLFVKNLENVQGDERDVMIFSVGYGPDEAGRLTLNFGPLNKEGGWRRLNVAITRARERVELVASFTARDLDTRGSTNRGVQELQRYLDYADRGYPALAIDLGQSEGEIESPLEQSVYATLIDWGFDVVPQVGTAGYRIDLGIRHPTEHGRFLLGVECDGAAYHSSHVARDRDRLRQEILEGLGWRMLRIWGPAWYRDRAGQERRLRAAIQEAVASAPHRLAPGPGPQGVPARQTTVAELDGPPRWSVPYRTCRPDLLGGARDNPADAVEWSRLTGVVHAIAKVEAPIRVGLLARRVGQVWDCNVTARVRAAVDRAVSALVRGGPFQLEGDVVRLPGSPGDQQVRIPDPHDDSTRRDITDIPPHELRLAVRLLLADARSVDDEELLTGLRSLFGFDRTGPRIRLALEEAVNGLVQEGVAARGDDGMLRVR